MSSAPAVINLHGEQYKVTPVKEKRSLLRRLAMWAVGGLLKGLWMLLLGVIFGTGRLARAATVGRRRHQWVPVWFALLAALPLPHAVPVWLALSVVTGVRPAFRDRSRLAKGWGWLASGRQVMSARELLWTSRACALMAVWHDLAPYAPPLYRLGSFTAAVGVWAVPWWWGRRVRETGDPVFPAHWAAQVVPQVPKLAGRFTEWDDEKGSGVLELSDAKASEAAKLDEDAEMAFSRAGRPMRRGMVTISNDPGLPVNQVRIVLAGSPEDMANRSRCWEGPTLGDPDGHGRLRQPGKYLLAVTKTGQEVWVMLRDVENGRARFFSWDGPTSTGKGGSMRITLVECALDPYTVPLIADGKWGAGLGYCRAATRDYADSPEAIEAQALRVRGILRHRAVRYGMEGRDSFIAGPREPHIFWTLDELPRILESKAGKTVASVLNETSAIGGSLGVTAGAAKQRGDAGSWGSGIEATTTRTNFAAGGGRWVGPSDDTQGSRSNAQKNDLDSSKLPRNGGWCFIVEGNPNPPESRGIWLPNRRDRDEKGRPAPFGVIEDWLERDTIHPELRPEEEAILFPDPLAFEAPVLRAVAAQTRDRIEVSATVPDDPEPAGSTEDAILRVLPGPSDDGVTRNDVRLLLEREEEITVTNKWVSTLLGKMAAETPPRTVNEAGKWRRAS